MDIFICFVCFVGAGECDQLRLRVIDYGQARSWVNDVRLVVAIGVSIVEVVVAEVGASDAIVVKVGTVSVFLLIDDQNWSCDHRAWI